MLVKMPVHHMDHPVGGREGGGREGGGRERREGEKRGREEKERREGRMWTYE